jgi:glycoside/pentoside/hexuronide:cation symporter, GPH family
MAQIADASASVAGRIMGITPGHDPIDAPVSIQVAALRAVGCDGRAMPIPEPPTKTRTRDIIGYSLGEGASSLTFNGISAFFMLYYTQALGLPYAKAAMAIAVSSLWDAIVDPLVGHLSDNTQSRWGRRQPYIMVGGLLMAVCFYYLWAVPGFVQRDGLLFFYAVFINFVYRTAYAVFYVPYVALGFEVCPGYHERSKLQATRMVLGMATNLFVALGWSLFFPDRPGGREATSVPANFVHMGTIFSFTAVGLTAVVLLAVRRHITDTRGAITGTGKGIRAYFGDFRDVITDRYLRPIMIFTCIGMIASVFVAMLQMYLYVYFLHLTALQKTMVHGGGMVLCALGALAGPLLERKFDKKRAVCIGATIMAGADLLAVFLSLSGLLQGTTTWEIGGHVVPVSVIVFGGCDMVNWFGYGLLCIVGISMIADAAEVNELESGVRKDGGYAAIYSFTTKLVTSVSMLAVGACLNWVGFASGSDRQTPSAIHGLVFLTFGLGSFFAVLVIPIALRSRISQGFMTNVKAALAEKRALTSDHRPGSFS